MAMTAHIPHSVKRIARRASPKRLVQTRLTRRVVEDFAEKVGLVYFGYVDQRDDEHRLVRGHTVSRSHTDNHYCIGTVRGYDVMFVLRSDVERTKSGKQRARQWLIFTIDLHTKTDVPPCYVGHCSEGEVCAVTYNRMHPLAIGGLGAYPHEFASNYIIYGAATHTLSIERTITPHIAQVMASHFAGASVEIEDNMVYLYVDVEHPTEAQLEKALSNSLWLAESIDALYAPPVNN